MAATVIITGANGGLGLWTSYFLIEKGFHIIAACRSLEKARADFDAFSPLKNSTAVTFKQLDLCNFESIRNFASSFSTSDSIHGIICNAGMSYQGKIRFTKQGIEETFCANYLGHYLLTRLLLKQTGITHIMCVSSALHDPAVKSPFPPPDFKPVHEMAFPKADDTSDKNFQTYYATSKLCEILFTYSLHRQLNQGSSSEKYFINAYNPGFMALTNFGRGKNDWAEKIRRYIIHLIGRAFGFATTAKKSGKYLARHYAESRESGKYFDQARLAASSKDSYDISKAGLLWQGSEELVKDYLN